MTDTITPAPAPSAILAEWRRLESELAEVVEERADCERLQRRIEELRRAYERSVEPAPEPLPHRPRAGTA